MSVIFAWQAQYLVKFKCHFSWQVQHLVKFGMIAGARNVACFNRKCSWSARKITSVARRVVDRGFHARIILGSCSDRPRIAKMTFHLFWRDFCEMLKSHFAWQAQYLVTLEGNLCCSAHCK